MGDFKFEVVAKSKKSRARVGKIHTPHGVIDTPSFVAVGTNACVKAIDSNMLEDIGLQLIFCNTYHLMLQPGSKLIKEAGGLHKFMNRNMPIITDSGGFQVFSLAYGTVKEELKSKGKKKLDNTVAKITEEGVLFRSYRDGAKILLTPENSVQAQKDLGADIIIPFDELPPYHTNPMKLKQSLERTHRWEERSLIEHKKNVQQQAMYAVVHGGIDKELRKKSCQVLTNLDFDGYAIGGSIGKNHQEMFELLKYTTPFLPTDKPNHLLGIGDLKSLEKSIEFGLDTFDSSHPTRCARHGQLFTKQGTLRILASSNKNKFSAPEEGCACFTCRNYTIAYLHHLFKANELTGYTLATIHNLHFMVKLMENYRARIIDGTL
jgi:queuine tRNA-ribosyltransferase